MIGLLALQAVMALSGVRFDLGQPAARPTSARPTSGCEAQRSGDEVIVCGGRRRNYRLPLRDSRRTAGERVRGEPATAADVLAGSGRCGLFAGERRCTTRTEAAAFGYGEGRDPITVLTRVAKAVAGGN